MKKLKKFIKKYYPEILSILIPFIIILVTALFCELYPFGKYSFAKYDGYYQYTGFTSYFRRVLLGQESLFYSFKGALGYNFFATSIYYMFNLTNLLSVFFDNNHLLEYYSILVYLRICLSGFTMCKFLKYKFKDKNNISYIIFSCAYALMSYNVAYFFNYMYFDVIVLFPIVMIGIHKILESKSSLTYIISLTLSILCNFYIGFMVCIFSVLYFIYNYILLEKKNKKIIFNFIISSLLSGLMCFIILLPVAYELLQGKVSLYNDPIQTNYFSFNINYLNIFYKFTPGSTTSNDIKYGTVNIYCSLFILILTIKYFFNTKISKKEKIVSGIFILFFMLSISFNLIDYAWHLMQRPIWYPNRYIFTFSFFLINIAYKSFKYNDSVKMNNTLKIIIIFILIALWMYPSWKSPFTNRTVQGISFLFSCMLIVQYMFFTENKNATILLIGLFITEIAINSIFTIKALSNANTFESFKKDNTKNEKIIEKIKIDNEDLFFRMELSDRLSYNNGAMYGYNGIEMFNSLRNNRIMYFFGKYFEYTTKDNASITMNKYNPYLLSIVGMKYMIGKEKEFYYTPISGELNKYIYKNEDALGLGFMVTNKVYNHNFVNDKILSNTQELVKTMSGNKNELYYKLDGYSYNHTYKQEKEDVLYIYNEIKPNDNNPSNKIIVSSNKYQDAKTTLEGIAKYDGFIYRKSNAAFYVNTKLYINGEYCEYCYRNTDFPIFIKKGDKFKFEFTSNLDYKFENIEYYIINYNEYKSFINEMKKNLLIITEYEKDNYLKGTVVSTKDKNVLFTSIPYDKGWKIKVDNKIINYKECYDAFICINLEEGEHDIVFKYTPKWFNIGLIISIASFITTIIYIIKTKKAKK